MARRLDDAKPGIGDLGKELGAAICRAVVRNDDLEPGVLLNQGALDAASHILMLLVENGNDQRYQGFHLQAKFDEVRCEADRVQVLMRPDFSIVLSESDRLR